MEGRKEDKFNSQTRIRSQSVGMNMQQNVPLKDFSNYGIGGPAKFFAELKSPNDLKEIDFSRFNNLFILGGGTNVLIPDEGFNGLVVYNNLKKMELKGDELHLGAGELIEDILNFCVQNSLSGLEWAGGLPGTIGGAVRGNAGAFKGEIKDNVFSIQSFNVRTGKITTKTNKQCEFGYRMSFFKKNPDEIITYVILKLVRGDKSSIEQQIQEKINYRFLKHPMEYPNIGSTFKNIPLTNLSEKLIKEFTAFIKNDPFPVVPTTKLLALAGLKGRREGDAQISEKHPNFIVNLRNARSSDVLKLIELAKKTVKEKWGIDLEEEIQILR